MRAFTEVIEDSLFVSAAAVQSYFQTNRVDDFSSIYPVAITNHKQASGWDNFKIKEGLLSIVSKKIGKTIRVTLFNESDAPEVNGFCCEKEKSADIYVNGGLNFCFRRFIVAKELNHLLMNKKDNSFRITPSTKNVINLISFLTMDQKGLNIDTSKAELSENAAYFGALELLVPKQYVDSDYFKMMNDVDTAQKLRSPVQVIELRKGVLDKTFQDVYDSIDFDNCHMLDTVQRARK